MRRATAPLCRRRHRRLVPCHPPLPAQAAGYYVIRWQNTGICQIWKRGP